MIKVALLSAFAAAAAAQPASTLSLSGTADIEVLRQESATPDATGVIRRYALQLPRYEVGAWWVAPNRANSMRPIAFQHPDGLPREGFFLLLKQHGGGYLAVLPLAGRATAAWLAPEPGRIGLEIGTYGTARVNGPFPVAAWARAADPYSACREVWRQAAKPEALAGTFQLRERKKIPEFLHYLGFATWEEYRENYDARKLVDMMRRIHASGVPVRWIQIGKGHHATKMLGDTPLLTGFDPDPVKFPEGWAPVMAARRENGVKWLGVFQALSGFPQGVHPQNALGALNRSLMPVPSGAVQPRNDPRAAAAFYDAMLAAVKRHGFAFIKMDFESNNFGLYRGTGNAIEAAVNNQRAYQAAAAKYLQGTINCMAHYPPGIFNTAGSTMTRVAQDYKKQNPRNARAILYNAYGNIPWAGQTVWGDHDMFHSSDTVSARMMSVAKAMSGGTVYLSDAVDRFATDLIAPLCYKDGRILRPLAPAAPLPESLFIQPAAQPYRVVAPLPGGAAAVVVYNLTDPAKEVQGFVEPDDYRNATVMMQPYSGPWQTPPEGLIAYDWRARKARRLTGAERFAMAAFTDRVLLLCPIRNGWSVIGRTDKYLSPAAVEVTAQTGKTLVLRMVESGPVAVWSARGKVSSKEARFRPAGDGLWTADLAAGRANFTVRLERTN